MTRIGHVAKDCTNNRVFDLSNIAEATVEVAWENLVKADAEKDLDDVRAVSDLASFKPSYCFTDGLLGNQGVFEGPSLRNLGGTRAGLPCK